MKLSPEESHVPRLLKHLHTITLEQSYKMQLEASHRRLQMLHGQVSRFFLDRLRSIDRDSETTRREWAELERVASQALSEARGSLQQLRIRGGESLQQRCQGFEQRLAELDAKAARALQTIFSSWEAVDSGDPQSGGAAQWGMVQPLPPA